jgi:CBS domain-containing protein
MANTAFWLGAMEGMAENFDDIRKYMSFDDARDNFVKGARAGMDCEFTWVKNQKMSARELTTQVLLPIARQGLEKYNIDTADIDKYLGIIEERAKRHMNGSRWILQAYTKFRKETHIDEGLTSLTAAIYHNQIQSKPAHEWPLPKLDEFYQYDPSQLLVEEFMTTDIFTLHEDDLLEFASSLMDWGDISSMPVEDAQGNLKGLITSKQILKYFAQKANRDENATVGQLMQKKPRTVTQQMRMVEVIKLMKEENLNILPVVKGNELIGMISERNFVNMSKRLIQGLHP